MARLFIFAIGGTGARVIRSLTILMAAGVKVPNCETIVPVLIDPDTQNGDLNRTVELLKLYEQLHDTIGPREGKFFGQSMQTLARIASESNNSLKDSFVYDFGGINQSFKEYLDYNGMSVDSQALIDLLFTKQSLEASLDVGFRGSPNVGSVVLNTLIESPEMKYLAQIIKADDRVFFISSIFGGTGAAGFPLLVKNLRHEGQQLPNPEHRIMVKAGALVVLPYFSLAEPSLEDRAAGVDHIDSRTFIAKTKDALKFYSNNLNGIEATYYLGDKPGNPLVNTPGRAEQRNAANLLELLGALAIPHFMDTPDKQLDRESPQYLEFGLEGDNEEITFKHLAVHLRQDVAKPLIRLHYFARYFINHMPDDKQQTYVKILNLHERLRNDHSLRSLTKFFEVYEVWLKELGTNSRTFKGLKADETSFNKMVYDKQIETTFFSKGITSKIFGDELSKVAGKDKPEDLTEPEALKRLVYYFDQATEELVSNKLKYN